MGMIPTRFSEILPTTSGSRCCYYPNLTDEETEAQRGGSRGLSPHARSPGFIVLGVPAEGFPFFCPDLGPASVTNFGLAGVFLQGCRAGTLTLGLHTCVYTHAHTHSLSCFPGLGCRPSVWHIVGAQQTFGKCRGSLVPMTWILLLDLPHSEGRTQWKCHNFHPRAPQGSGTQ